MASSADSYGKWLGDLLMAALTGLLLLDCVCLLLIRNEIDVEGLAVVNAGILVLVAILFSVVGLFRSRKAPSPGSRSRSLIVMGFLNFLAMIAYGIDMVSHYSITNNHNLWLRPLMICMYLVAAVSYFYSGLRSRKCNV